MNRVFATLVFLLFTGFLSAQEPLSDSFAAKGASQSAIPVWEAPATAFKMGLVSTAILSVAEPEAALARASILTPRLHGNVGEAFVNSQLHATGGWKPIPPRTAPQGLDHVWMKFDKVGRPTGLIVGETKFGTSRLGMTKTGRQMSASWISKRLAGLADDWDSMAKGVAARLGEARARPYRLRADHLRAAAEGRVSYRSELFRVKVDGDIARISIQKLGPDGLAAGPVRDLPSIQIKGQPAQLVKAQLIGEIRKTYPALADDPAGAKRLAEQAYTQAKNAQVAISRKSAALRLTGTTGAVLAAGGLVAGGADAIVQLLLSGDNFDWRRAGTMAGLGSFSAASAEAAQLATSQALLRSAAFRSRSIALGKSMGLLSSRTVSLLPKAVGGIGGVLAFSYGGYALGLYDVKEANRSAIAGTAGVAAGMATYSAMMAAAAAWGTASTGTAISTLSGAAAYNASLAMYGGGAVAAGGGGMSLGSLVVGGAVGVAIVGVTAAVMYGFHLHDEAQEWERIGNTIDVLREHTGDYPGNPWARPATAF